MGKNIGGNLEGLEKNIFRSYFEITIAAMGLSYLIRILRNHPLPKEIPEMEVDKGD